MTGTPICGSMIQHIQRERQSPVHLMRAVSRLIMHVVCKLKIIWHG